MAWKGIRTSAVCCCVLCVFRVLHSVMTYIVDRKRRIINRMYLLQFDLPHILWDTTEHHKSTQVKF